MTKHRRYSRKRNHKKQRRASRKMKGGLAENDRQALLGLGFTEQQVNYLFDEHPDMDIAFFENSVNGIPGNQFFPQPQTPDAIIANLQENDLAFVNTNDSLNMNDSLNTTRPDESFDSDVSFNMSDISEINPNNEAHDIDVGYDFDDEFLEPEVDSMNNSVNTSQESLGGKRRKKQRHTKKKYTNKRKTKQSKKTRKHRKRKQRGGDNTDTEYLNPNEMKDEEYMLAKQMKMVH